ncbi:MAG TPA: HAD-IA family hydrolase [Gammaproteobacteria bacterium]|nr:HAD-IA family hydrolase [Gammaproteobacteria bacterium]
MSTPKFKAVIFDLDGTLVDTAPDLASALNYILIMDNRAPLDFDDIRHVASDGAKGLINLGFHISDKDPLYGDLRKKLLHFYLKHIADRSVLFEGIDEILHLVERSAIPWGIVTNKPTDLTLKLLHALNLDKRTHCVVCGDTVKERKPHPEPLLYAAKLLNVAPEDCCYIGDAERDMQAAKAAHMTAIFASYGYIHESEKPEDMGADYIIQTPLDLRSIL